jgi:hypothetical protein
MRKEQRRGRRIFLPVGLYLAGRVGKVDSEFETRRYKKMTRELSRVKIGKSIQNGVYVAGD